MWLRQAARNAFVQLTACCFLPQLLLYVLPLPLPLPLADNRDPSWQLLLTENFLQPVSFGRDFIFTYGPWGVLLQARGTPAHYPIVLLGRLLASFAFCWSVATLLSASRIRNSTARKMAIAIGVLANPFFLLPVTTLLLLDREHRDKRVTWTALAATALAALVKFSFAMVAGVCLAAALASATTRRRAAQPFWMAGWFILFWLLARQSLSDLPVYFRMSWEVASLYSASMQGETTTFALGMVVAMLVAGAVAAWRMREDYPAVVFPALLLCLFVIFKQVAVRQDNDHFLESGIRAAIPAYLLLGARAGAVSRSWLSFAAIAFAFQIGPCYPLFDIFKGVATLRSLPLGPSGWERLHQENFAAVRRLNPMPIMGGAADVMPTDQSLLSIAGIPAKRRPVPQSYAVTGAILPAVNAQSWESASGPSSIYLTVDPIDKRYPTLEDPLCWRSLLTHFEPAEFANGYLRLARSPQAVAIEPQPLIDRELPLGEALRGLPAEPLWAEIDVRPSLLSRFVSTLYQAPAVDIDIEFGGKAATFRFLPATGGFLLSPYIESPPAFALLYTANPPLPWAQAIWVRVAPIAKLLFDSHSRVRLYRLRIPTRGPSVIAPNLVALARTLRSESSLSGDAARPRWLLEKTEPRLIAPAPSQGEIAVQSISEVRVRFGVMSACKDTAAFVIEAADSHGPRSLLRETAHDAVTRTLTFARPWSGVLRFRTEPSPCAAEAYWSAVDTIALP